MKLIIREGLREGVVLHLIQDNDEDLHPDNKCTISDDVPGCEVLIDEIMALVHGVVEATRNGEQIEVDDQLTGEYTRKAL